MCVYDVCGMVVGNFVYNFDTKEQFEDWNDVARYHVVIWGGGGLFDVVPPRFCQTPLKRCISLCEEATH